MHLPCQFRPIGQNEWTPDGKEQVGAVPPLNQGLNHRTTVHEVTVPDGDVVDQRFDCC